MRIPVAQTRFQAPIRHVFCYAVERCASSPLNAPPVVTGSHPVISATSTVIIQMVRTLRLWWRTSDGSSTAVPGQGQLLAFLRTYN